ncbi:MAG: DNA-processing protein DprA, partial [Candidatus Uhrbacteria bacterium]
FLLALVRFPKFGPIRLAKLRGFFDSMEAAFNADRNQLLAAKIEPRVTESFLEARNKLSPEKELLFLEKSGATAISFTDPNYPALLKTIYDPPAVLFVRGRLPESERLMLAVVGSRKPTNYGARVVSNLVEPMAASNVVIVSGLAYGIDTLVHEATLKVSGTTIAVLGAGVDEASIFPAANRGLAQKIITNGGAIISEFPLGTTPMKQNFPIRNRVIAGLCHGTLIIEAAKTSGSLITARAALEAGREVFAVPGPIGSENSEGTNQLLKTGAHVVTEAEDILSALGLATIHTTKPPLSSDNVLRSSAKEEGGGGLVVRCKPNEVRVTKISPIPGSPEEAEILKLLSTEPIHIDDLARATNKKISEISHVLTLMEMKGSARHVGGLYYTIG